MHLNNGYKTFQTHCNRSTVPASSIDSRHKGIQHLFLVRSAGLIVADAVWRRSPLYLGVSAGLASLEAQGAPLEAQGLVSFAASGAVAGGAAGGAADGESAGVVSVCAHPTAKPMLIKLIAASVVKYLSLIQFSASSVLGIYQIIEQRLKIAG